MNIFNLKIGDGNNINFLVIIVIINLKDNT